MFVAAVGTVDMPLGYDRDGHRAPAGRSGWGLSGRVRCCRVAVVVPMVVMGMAVIVAVRGVMSLSVVACAVSCGVGAAFGLERQVLLGHDQVHGAQHVGQNVVGLDLEVVGSQFDGDVAVAQW